MNTPFNISDSWKPHVSPVIKAPYYLDLVASIKKEYEIHTCYPKQEAVFAAFEQCSFEETKVVILGQDPYHGEGQANGLCFSVHEGVNHPPSLRNIFKELETDVDKPYPQSGNLEHWAKQGVLLLNATLTVQAHHAGSHQKKGWEKFTDDVIRIISKEKTGVIFLLWGGYAKKKAKLIDATKHHILTSGHPSPLSANRGFWFGNQHFSKTNKILMQQGNKSISW